MHWKCSECGSVSDSAESCGAETCLWRDCDRQPVLTAEDSSAVALWAQTIHDNINRVCHLLDYSMDYYEIDEDVVGIYWRDGSRYGNGGTVVESFPLDYLCMTDEEVKKTAAGRKAETARVRVEREAAQRKTHELAAAKRQLQQADAKVRTAQKDAERALAEARKRLERLERLEEGTTP